MNYYVAVLDILGFKNLILRKPLRKLAVSMEKLWPQIIKASASLGAIKEGAKGEVTINERKASVNYGMFSDTIIFFAKDDPVGVKVPKNFLNLVWTLPLALAFGFSGKSPLRGAVAYGEFYGNTDKLIFIGKTMVEAYDYAHSQDWSGVVFCPSVIYEMKKREIDILKIPCILEYNVPFKNEKRKVPTINWTPLIVNPDAISCVFWENSEEVRTKCGNTIEFYNFCKTNNLTIAYKGMNIMINVEIKR